MQADDTHILVLQPGDETKKGGKGTSRGHIWAFVGDGRFVSYAYAPNWRGEHPQKLLEGCTGWLQGDGDAGYAELYAREGGTGRKRTYVACGGTVDRPRLVHSPASRG